MPSTRLLCSSSKTARTRFSRSSGVSWICPVFNDAEGHAGPYCIQTLFLLAYQDRGSYSFGYAAVVVVYNVQPHLQPPKRIAWPDW